MENKSIGGALVEVFDAAVTLVKSEITAIARRVGNIAKAKGLGVVLLLASLVPLTLALIFLILFVFYGLMRLGLGAWAAALLIALVSLAVTAALIFMGLRKLGEDVPDDTTPGNSGSGKMSDIAKDDLKYGSAAQSSAAQTQVAQTPVPQSAVVASVPTAQAGHTTGGHPVQSPARPVKADPHGAAQAQSTSTQGAPSTPGATAGIKVSTHPTYQDDMKKEGY